MLQPQRLTKEQTNKKKKMGGEEEWRRDFFDWLLFFFFFSPFFALSFSFAHQRKEKKVEFFLTHTSTIDPHAHQYARLMINWHNNPPPLLWGFDWLIADFITKIIKTKNEMEWEKNHPPFSDASPLLALGFFLFLLTFSFDLWKLDQVCPAFVRNCLMSRGVIEEESRDKEKEVESEKSKTTAPFQPQRHVCPVRGRGGEGSISLHGEQDPEGWWWWWWKKMPEDLLRDLIFSFLSLSFFPSSLSLSPFRFRNDCIVINHAAE